MSITDILFDCEVAEGDLDEFPSLLRSRFPFGNYLVLTDEENALTLGNALKKIPKKLMAVVGGKEDVLPLFGSSDGITCVVGAGKATEAARYFACARSLPFVSVCLSCAPSGLQRGKVSVTVNGGDCVYPVPLPKLLFFDGGRAAKDEKGILLASAFLLASELSLFSAEAVSLLGLSESESSAVGDSAFTFVPDSSLSALLSAACAFSSSLSSFGFERSDALALFRAVLTAEYCFRLGFPEGEIFRFVYLAEKISGASCRALLFPCTKSLAELYKLFFESGFYRGGKVDYNARYSRAAALADKKGIFINNINIPTTEQLKFRAEKFGKHKNALFQKISVLSQKIGEMSAIFEKNDAKNEVEGIGEILRLLPELSLDTKGIATLMRDFSLL